MTVSERIQAPTPKFFKIIRNVGILLGAIGAAILASPIAIPAGIATAAGYLVVTGTVATAVSQTTVCGESGETETSK